MSDPPTYTIAICHYEMADTIERSLTSILRQTDDRFEVLVIDDGSTDGSLRILRRLESEYSSLRVVKSDNNNLAEARNESFQKARGEYILESLDCDDYYDNGIMDFIEVYHKIEDVKQDEFYLKGVSINMAPKELLLEYPYRSLGYGEDRDLWRRLFADNKIIWFNHASFVTVLREPYSKLDHCRHTLEIRVVDFRGGVTFSSYVRWCLGAEKTYQAIWRLIIGLIALPIAYKRGRYSYSEEFKQMGALSAAIDHYSHSISDLENRFGIEINSDIL